MTQKNVLFEVKIILTLHLKYLPSLSEKEWVLGVGDFQGDKKHRHILGCKPWYVQKTRNENTLFVWKPLRAKYEESESVVFSKRFLFLFLKITELTGMTFYETLLANFTEAKMTGKGFSFFGTEFTGHLCREIMISFRRHSSHLL